MAIAEVTLSGTDVSGNVWENVIHFETDDTAGTQKELMDDLAQKVQDDLLDSYQAAMNENCIIRDIGVRILKPFPSYASHYPVNLPGSRSGKPAPGAVSLLLRLAAAVGTVLGGLYLVGLMDEDYDGDSPSETYLAFVAAIATALIGFNGTTGLYAWQIVNFAKESGISTPFTAWFTRNKMTTLNKRMRP